MEKEVKLIKKEEKVDSQQYVSPSVKDEEIPLSIKSIDNNIDVEDRHLIYKHMT